MFRHRLAAVLAAGLAFAAAPAAATVYTFEQSDPHGIQGGAGGTVITSVSGSYDAASQQFGFSYTQKGKKADGYWLVMSDGPNPKGDVNEYAILYADFKKNRVSAFTYNGVNGPDSYRNPGEFIGAYDDALRITQKNGLETVALSLDVAGINGFEPKSGTGVNEWSGVAFGEQVGWWLHTSTDSRFCYCDGVLGDYSFSGQNWSDTANVKTSWDEPPAPDGAAPLPAAALFLGLGAAWVARRRRGA